LVEQSKLENVDRFFVSNKLDFFVKGFILSELDPSSLVGLSTGTENGKFGLENGF
jgi:hypothetical protein